ncbi:MAG: Gfo/Idh/MocA family oxidoreductase [Candidatus Bathyarchaeia archaeon]
MESPINVGIIGYGYSGRNFHSYLIGFEKRLKLYAVCARNPDRRKQAEREYGVKTYCSVEEMLNDDNIHLVVVATPHNTHAELSIKAMEAGKHVVVEKIMCMNVREADAMISASRKNNVMLTVFHNRRWDGDYLTIKQILNEGLLGEPYLIEESILWYNDKIDAQRWRSKKELGGGPLCDWGAHLIDHAVQIGKVPVDKIYCLSAKLRKEVDIESYVKCLIHFENGLTYGVELGDMARINRPRWYILGTLGALTKTGVDPQERAMNAGNIDAAVESPENYAFVRTMKNGVVSETRVQTLRGDWKLFYRNVADHLVDGKELAVKPEEIRRVVAIAETALQSAQEQRSISCKI